jgi:hypothetical protein
MDACGHGIISKDIIPAPNEVSAHPGTECHTMDACGHGIILKDIIPAPNEVSAHPGTECHTMNACGHDIISTVSGLIHGKQSIYRACSNKCNNIRNKDRKERGFT